MASPVTPGEGWTGSDPDVWRYPREELHGDVQSRPRRRRNRAPIGRSVRDRELKVLGWNQGSAEPPTVWDKEPLLTVKSAPKLFGYGVPAIVVVGIGMLVIVAAVSLKWAFLLSFVVQAVGIATLYGIAHRRRSDPLTKHLPGYESRRM